MDRNDVNWKGYWPAATTPFTRDGAFDEAAWRALLRLYLSQGMHGILVNGTTGEWYAQSDDERRRVAEIAVEELAGRMTVAIGCTTFTPGHTVELAKHARAIGADAVLSTPPPYAAPNPDEIVEFYRYISDRVDIPLMVYNWPRGTAVEIPKDVALRLVEIPNVVAIKDSTSNQAQFYETLEAVVGEIRVFGNFMNPLGIAVLREIGGDGSIGGGAILGAEQPEFYEAVWRGDLERAKAIARKQAALSHQLMNPDYSGKHGSPQSWLKAAMNMMGQPGGYPRRPLLPVEDSTELAAIRAALESVGLIRQEALVASS